MWGLGTAAGLTVVGLLVHAEHSAEQLQLASPAHSAEDIPPADGPG
ncbi:hypothetical protein ACIQCR_27640 [Streptomyces sp. NPDC093249]